MGSAGGTDFTKAQNGGLGVQFDFFDIGFRVFFFLCIHSFDSGSVYVSVVSPAAGRRAASLIE
jgi:hypothetical protein